MDNNTVKVVYKLKWLDWQGKYHVDFFVHIRNPHWVTYDVSYVHKCTEHENALRRYLSHIPILDVQIERYIQE